MHKENIFLIGPMGAGKSTVGRLLAEKLHYHFVDTDHEIEAKTGVTIPMIFDIEGEEGFRAREAQAIDELTQCSETVLATGGGAILRPENRMHLRSRGVVVYLKASVEALIARTQHDRNRPLLQTENPAESIRQILEAREVYYEDVADFVIETEGESAHKVVRTLLAELQQENII